MDKPTLFNLEAEQAVIGSLLIDRDAMLFVREILRPEDFHISRHRWIYEIIADMHDKGFPADLLTIHDELDKRKRAREVDSPAYLTQMINVTPTSVHAEHYARMVKKYSVMRQLSQAAGAVAKVAHNSELTTDEALQQASESILSVSTANIVQKPQPVGVFVSKAMDEIQSMMDGESPGLPVGVPSLTKRLGGLKPGKLYLLAGRPGMGKSALALQAAAACAKGGKRGLYFSVEMPGTELVMRLIASEAKIDGERIQNGQIAENEWPVFYEATSYIDTWPLYIDDRSHMIEAIRSRATLESASDLDLVVVDYIQLVEVSKNYQNRDSEIGAISKALKQLAKDLSIPVVAVASLNRECEKRGNKRPMLSDLRESGSLEYDADVVVFLYRDEIYNADTEYPNLAEAIIAKQRGGKLGTVQMYFKKEFTTFIDLETRVEPLEPVYQPAQQGRR